ncbi:unnamed protein product [Linum trigynum]|uniref:TIR domain-containing protein n=1 Tax=Linum trigynum TaxID=586398 RepID=A0AAV2CQB1_9ROSI
MLPLPRGEYEVFLSFRGPDVRTTFADFLYEYLDHSKIRTFIDEEELHKGEDIAPSLVHAIEESKIYIPILSKDYAASKWCLQELALMVRCFKQGKGHVILPIFYMVEPRDVRRQVGAYEEAFRGHVEEYDAAMVEEWKEALAEVGKMKGWHVTEIHKQGAIIDDVFSKVWSQLTRNYTLVTDELVGIDSHVGKVTELLELNRGGPKIVGIHGMGGIGKTAIAKAIYNKVCAQFNRHCFLKDVRETLSDKKGGVLALQNAVISSILRSNDHQVADDDEGIHVIRNRVCKQKVLIVIDDVDDRFRFEKIFGRLENFSSGSRFIVTTRDKRAIELFQEYELYEPKGMSEEHSFQLFARHAFGVDCPPDDYVDLSNEFVRVVEGLPLALKVIGSLLFRKDKSFWKAKLRQLEDVPPSELQEVLKIGYSELTLEEKQVFLDIACFFIGEEKERPFYMWSDCGFHPEITINTLILRSLIKVNNSGEGGEFWMHDHVRDLGRAIVRDEDTRRPWKRSRIWNTEDALNILTHEKGTDRLEAMRINMEDENAEELTSRHFVKLFGLRYLEVVGGGLVGNFRGILPNIRWFQLHDCTSIPDDLDMKKLVVFDITNCPVTDDWRAWNRFNKDAQKLKVVDLTSCYNLTRAPDFSRGRSLELICLFGCTQMSGQLHIGNSSRNLTTLNLAYTRITELRGDVRTLPKLQVLNAGHTSLRELPNDLYRLSSLERLDLGLEMREESKLKKVVPRLPTSLKQLSLSSSRVPNLLELWNLEELCFKHCDDLEIPGDIWRLSKLKSLELSFCSCESLLLEDGSEMASLPSSLTHLDISTCSPLERLPSLANLVHLKEMQLRAVGVSDIPGLGELKMLETLEIYHAPNLTHLDGVQCLAALKTLTLQGCPVLEKLPSLSNLTKLHSLTISFCKLLSEIQGLGQGESWEHDLLEMEIRGCPSLAIGQGTILLAFRSGLGKLKKLVLDLSEIHEHHIPTLDLSGLHNVQEVSITGSSWLTKVEGLEKLESLESLCMSNCTSIRELSCGAGLKNLKDLQLDGCTQLTKVSGLERLESLDFLNMSGCRAMEELPSLSMLSSLTTLNIEGWTQLNEVVQLDTSESLRLLSMGGCTSIKELELSGLFDLETLIIDGCTQLAEVTGMEGLQQLEWVDMSSCPSLEELPNLPRNISILNIDQCEELSEVMGLLSLEPSLKELRMYNCSSVKNLPDLSGFMQLSWLDIRGCIQLSEVTGIERLESLDAVYMD